MNTEQLQSLLDRVREATGADRELDVAILDAIDPVSLFSSDMSGFVTASIDAALALTERVLPETARTGFQQNPDKSWHAAILRVEPDEGECLYAAAPTAPLAILAATLSSVIEAGRIK